MNDKFRQLEGEIVPCCQVRELMNDFIGNSDAGWVRGDQSDRLCSKFMRLWACWGRGLSLLRASDSALLRPRFSATCRG